MNLDITILENGNLELSVDQETSDEIQDLIGEIYPDAITADLFEEHSCNGSYTFFDAGQGNPNVGLTSAPCIAESMDYEDDGQANIEGRLWYDADYMLVDFLQVLSLKGKYIFFLAK